MPTHSYRTEYNTFCSHLARKATQYITHHASVPIKGHVTSYQMVVFTKMPYAVLSPNASTSQPERVSSDSQIQIPENQAVSRAVQTPTCGAQKKWTVRSQQTQDKQTKVSCETKWDNQAMVQGDQ